MIVFCTKNAPKCIKFIEAEEIENGTTKNNDLFFTCSLIEYIARKTKNTKKEVVEKLGNACYEEGKVL